MISESERDLRGQPGGPFRKALRRILNEGTEWTHLKSQVRRYSQGLQFD